MDESKPVEEIRTSEHPPWYGHRPIQGESNIGFLGESEGSLPPPCDIFPEWLEEFTRQSRGHRSVCIRAQISGLRFGKFHESEIEIKEAHYKNTLPKRPKLRDLPDDKGTVQKTHWRSRTSCKQLC